MIKIIILLFLSSCVTTPQNDEENILQKQREEQDDESNAKLFQKIEQLEIQLKSQNEKILLLEKGLLLGVIPEELKPNKKEEIKKEDVTLDEFQMDLKKGIEMFDKGSYGEAYLHFSYLNSKYDEDKKQDEIFYWTGRCQFELKEYNHAKALFEQELKKYSNHKNSASAKIYLAKSQMELGDLANALVLLQSVANSKALEKKEALELIKKMEERI